MPGELELLSKRLKVVKWLILLLFAAICLRTFWLQVGEAIPWLSSARRQQTIVLVQPADRGRIFDSRGRVLADNAPGFVLLGSLTEHQTSELDELKKVLTGPQASDFARSGRAFLTESQLPLVSELVTHTQGLRLEQSMTRFYPHNSLASHAIGYVKDSGFESMGTSQASIQGVDGLEAIYNTRLSGVPGKRVELVSALGRRLGLVSEKQPQRGADIFCSLDIDLQAVAEKELERADARLKGMPNRRAGGPAVALMMDAQTGEIQVMASRPSFDPNLFVKPNKELAKVLRDPHSPLMNRAIAGLYPPASTFKLTTAYAVLRYHPTWAKEQFYCTGSKKIGNTNFNCFVTSGHGRLNFEEALALSCDSVFYDFATRLSFQELSFTAQELGYGRLSGIDLPGESPGSFPALKALKAEGKPWYAGDAANLGIGQGYLLATPLQVLLSAARLVGNPSVQPRMLKLSFKNKVRHQQRSGIEALRSGTKGTISYGTASGLPWIAGLKVAGKTGTAEAPVTLDNPQALNHTWFVGWAPADTPKVVVLVFFEGSGGYGGEVAAPVASTLLKAWHESTGI